MDNHEEAKRLRDEDFDELMAACDTAKNAVKKDNASSKRATVHMEEDAMEEDVKRGNPSSKQSMIPMEKDAMEEDVKDNPSSKRTAIPMEEDPAPVDEKPVMSPHQIRLKRHAYHNTDIQDPPAPVQNPVHQVASST
ncbi:hypothetical protein OSTOST_07343 [Ostertagia ostertagi]